MLKVVSKLFKPILFLAVSKTHLLGHKTQR